jgi:hypothetical protein
MICTPAPLATLSNASPNFRRCLESETLVHHRTALDPTGGDQELLPDEGVLSQ